MTAASAAPVPAGLLTLDAGELSRFMRDVLTVLCAKPAAAQEAADCLTDADLDAIDTHGTANFVSH